MEVKELLEDKTEKPKACKIYRTFKVEMMLTLHAPITGKYPNSERITQRSDACHAMSRLHFRSY